MAILVVGSQVKYIVLKAEILEVLVKIERRQKGKKKMWESFSMCVRLYVRVCVHEREKSERGGEEEMKHAFCCAKPL